MTKRNDRPRRIGLGITLACCLGTVCVTVLALDDRAIPWRTDLPRAEIEARAQNRLLWVQFTGSWCPNCVRLERDAFVHPRVVGQARDFFVPVKIQSDEHEDLVERYGLTGIPATILVKPSGEVLARHEGYVDAATFGTFLDRALIRSGRMHGPARSELTRTATTTSRKARRPGDETQRR
jgi:thioredoxin-like negative regulator of GroEL